MPLGNLISFHLVSRFVMPAQLTSPHLTSPHLILSDLKSFHVTSSPVISPHHFLNHLIPFHPHRIFTFPFISSHLISSGLMSLHLIFQTRAKSNSAAVGFTAAGFQTLHNKTTQHTNTQKKPLKPDLKNKCVLPEMISSW